MRHTRTITIVLITCAALVGLIGCQTDKHTMTDMTDAKPGTKPVCGECYELAQQYRKWYPTGSGGRSGSAGGGGGYRIVVDRIHQCRECRSEVTFYTENGVQKIKCTRCAPEGLACDLCAPPK